MNRFYETEAKHVAKEHFSINLLLQIYTVFEKRLGTIYQVNIIMIVILDQS